MKGLKASLILVAAGLMILGMYGTSYAYHDGGVAYCEGCHTMHNSINNAPVSVNGSVTTQFNGNTYLLKGTDQSSTCLNCHYTTGATPNGYHVMSSANAGGAVPTQRTPGGDFAWLRIPDTSAANTYGGMATNQATHRGHNIVAADFGMGVSTVYTAAPGGTYPSADLRCSSCHDPHARARVSSSYQIVNAAIGQAVGPIIASGSYGTTLPGSDSSGNGAVGVYRLLGGAGYLPDSISTDVTLSFANPSPFAFAPSTYNRTEAATDTRVAYGSGMSEWCSNCHTKIHNPNYAGGVNEHPTGNGNPGALLTNNDDAQLNVTIAQAYNAYVKSGDLTGNQATSYLSMVPYEEGLAMNAANYATLASHVTTSGPSAGPSTGSENVMCLSCHRAHASGLPYSLRWNATSAEFLTLDGAYPGVDGTTAEQKGGQYNLGYTQAQMQATFYDRPATVWASYQRSLCNKCHARD